MPRGITYRGGLLRTSTCSAWRRSTVGAPDAVADPANGEEAVCHDPGRGGCLPGRVGGTPARHAGGLRCSIRTVVPDAEEGISYGVPAFRVSGHLVDGFAAFKNHLAYLPHSGRVLADLNEELTGSEHMPGSPHFPMDETVPDHLLRRPSKGRSRSLTSELRTTARPSRDSSEVVRPPVPLEWWVWVKARRPD